MLLSESQCRCGLNAARVRMPSECAWPNAVVVDRAARRFRCDEVLLDVYGRSTNGWTVGLKRCHQAGRDIVDCDGSLYRGVGNADVIAPPLVDRGQVTRARYLFHRHGHTRRARAPGPTPTDAADQEPEPPLRMVRDRGPQRASTHVRPAVGMPQPKARSSAKVSLPEERF